MTNAPDHIIPHSIPHQCSSYPTYLLSQAARTIPQPQIQYLVVDIDTPSQHTIILQKNHHLIYKINKFSLARESNIDQS